MSRADSAVPTRLSSIRDELIARKLRLVGRVIYYDLRTATAVLWNEGHAIAVDVALCLNARGSLPWLVDARSIVTIFGYLERLNAPLHIPDTPQVPSFTMIPHLRVQAIMAIDSPDVDLAEWNETVAQMEAMGVLSDPATSRLTHA